MECYFIPFRCRLSETLSLLASRLAEVKTRSKRLGAMRQSRQNDLYTVQQNIRERTAQIIEHIKQRESFLLADAQSKFESGISTVSGCDSLAELDFHRLELEQLMNEVRLVLGGTPQSCLVVFDALMARVTRLTDSAPNSLPTLRIPQPKSVCFIPAPASEVDMMIGCLQECSFTGTEDASEDNESPSTTLNPSHGNIPSPRTSHVSVSGETNSTTRKRTASILGAISPARKTDSRMGRIKGIARSNGTAPWRDNVLTNSASKETWREVVPPASGSSVGPSWRDGVQSTSPITNTWRDNSRREGSHSARHINFDNMIGSTTRTVESQTSPTSRSGSLSFPSPASPVSSSVTKPGPTSSPSTFAARLVSSAPRLLFKIDQVWSL